MIHAITSVLGLRMLGIVFQLGWFMLLVRLLPIDEVGMYAAINAFWLLMRALGPLGSDQALMKTMPTLLEAGELSKARQWQRHALLLTAGRLMTLLALALTGALVAQKQGIVQVGAELLVLSVTTALFYGINGLQTFTMLAARRPLLANGWETVFLPLALILASGALYAANAMSLMHLLLAQTLIMFGFCLLGLWLVGRLLRAPETIPTPLDKTERRQFARTSLALLGTSALIHVTMRTPVMIAPLLMGAAQTALLETAVRFATLLGLVGYAAAQVVLPQLSTLSQDDSNKTQLQALLHQSSWLIFLPTLALYAGMVLLGEWALGWLIGEAYRAAYLPMVLLGLGYLINAGAGPMQHVFTMKGRPALVSQASMVELLLIVLLVLLLASEHGALGMAAAMALGMALRNLIFHIALPRLFGLMPGVFSFSGARWLLARGGRLWQH